MKHAHTQIARCVPEEQQTEKGEEQRIRKIKNAWGMNKQKDKYVNTEVEKEK